jgi:hypothetical protein
VGEHKWELIAYEDSWFRALWCERCGCLCEIDRSGHKTYRMPGMPHGTGTLDEPRCKRNEAPRER